MSCDYLDLWCIYNYTIVGDIWLSIIIALGLITYFCLKNAVPFQVVILLDLLCLMVAVSITQLGIIWTFVVLAIGAIAYYLIQKSMRR